MNSFKYDPFGRRVYKSSSSGTSVFAYDGDNLVEETSSTGSVVARYQQTQSIDEPLAMLRSSATSYYHADGLGSVTSLSNSAGSIANTYDSYGNSTTSTGSLVNPFRYTAREFDSETGLYYYRARYCDSTTGRFLSEDPIGFEAGANFYSYVQNDPQDWVDEDGTQRDRSTTGRPDGTPNPFKKLTPDPDDPNKVIYRDPKTGKQYKKAKPPGFDDYRKKKHPEKKTQTEECPAPPKEPDPKPEPSQFSDPYCQGPTSVDCIQRPWPLYDQPLLVPTTPGVPIPWRIPINFPIRFPIRLPIFDPVFVP
jgi:RHS repeat-associated protein